MSSKEKKILILAENYIIIIRQEAIFEEINTFYSN